MPLSSRLSALAAAVSLGVLVPASAAVLEYSGDGTVVGVAGAAPDHVSVDPATSLGFSFAFDSARPAVAVTATSATYEAFSAYAIVDERTVPLRRATLTLAREQGMAIYRFIGESDEGWRIVFHADSADPAFLPSLALPAEPPPGVEDAWAGIALEDDAGAWVAYSDHVGVFEVRAIADPDRALLPVIEEDPSGGVVARAKRVVMRVRAAGEGPLLYQWQKDGRDLPGATGRTLVLRRAQLADSGTYRVVVANPHGSVTSGPARLIVAGPPRISRHPRSQFIPIEGRLRLEVRVQSALSVRYQWLRNGRAIAGATGPVLLVSRLQSGHTGVYRVIVGNDAGWKTSLPARVQVKPAARRPPA